MTKNQQGTVAAEIKADGSFNRQKNRFDTPFGYGEGELPVEAGRYRLLWSAVCPWAHRSVIVRRILGLEECNQLRYCQPDAPQASSRRLGIFTR